MNIRRDKNIENHNIEVVSNIHNNIEVVSDNIHNNSIRSLIIVNKF